MPAPPVPPLARHVLDQYATTAPHPRNAIDIFAGEWASRLPVPGTQSGAVPLFEDDRVVWGLEHLGGVAGQRVLELGPL